MAADHGDHPVRDNEVDRRRCAIVENAAMDSFPVENVLRPAMLDPSTMPNVFFVPSVTPGPMRFDLGHGYAELGASTVRSRHR